MQVIVNHVVKYQNNFVSSYLFRKCFHKMVEKGIEVAQLLNSHVFSFTLDFDEWPSIHTDDESYIRPYNGSILDLRNKYREVFPEESFEPLHLDDDENQVESNKLHKIKYSINLIPVLGEYIAFENGIKVMKNKG